MQCHICSYVRTWEGAEGLIGTFVDAVSGQIAHLAVKGTLDLLLKDTIKEIV